ncbi:hypothetical protein DY000_02020290 [Brassica cretica]|uniref:Uncharacterized protein n=1 Tax=Brassica cretica TaxID=69181 RepID=A0ABQ7E2U1_BRACR|nr:hypothetical protein DY000_02020290 [Brassica cretica]
MKALKRRLKVKGGALTKMKKKSMIMEHSKVGYLRYPISSDLDAVNGLECRGGIVYPEVTVATNICYVVMKSSICVKPVRHRNNLQAVNQCESVWRLNSTHDPSAGPVSRLSQWC